MADLLTINITNRSGNIQPFFLFQTPAEFSGGGQVFSNALGMFTLLNYDQSGAILTFQINRQRYACAQQSHNSPQVGQASGYAAAVRPIELAPGNSVTTASISPMGLSQPVGGQGGQPGTFRIMTQAYAPPTRANLGQAIQVNGDVVLSSFVEAMPNYAVDCRPIDKFYIARGSYQPGSVIDFRRAADDAALCDLSGGHRAVNVTLNADGTWMTQLRQ